MAITNPTEIFNVPANVKGITTAGGLAIALNSDKVYTLKHMAVAQDESADTNVVWLTFAENNETATAPVAASKFTVGQIRLASGEEITVGPELTSLKLIVGAGAPVVRITPKVRGA